MAKGRASRTAPDNETSGRLDRTAAMITSIELDHAHLIFAGVDLDQVFLEQHVVDARAVLREDVRDPPPVFVLGVGFAAADGNCRIVEEFRKTFLGLRSKVLDHHARIVHFGSVDPGQPDAQGDGHFEPESYQQINRVAVDDLGNRGVVDIDRRDLVHGVSGRRDGSF